MEESLLTRLIKKFEPSLIHLHVVYGFAREVVYAKEKLGIPFIISEHMAPFPFDWLADKEGLIKKPMQNAA